MSQTPTASGSNVSAVSYEPVIGMEVHAELLTTSKMFCACSAKFGGDPNTRCCPVCLGLPGALPVANRQAIEFVVKAALALNCHINRETFFHRKNYFYPDLPKGYQISQYGDTPIGVNGWVEIDLEDGSTKRIAIRRVHLEEDTGKLLHSSADTSEVDYNRSTVPLMEIVTNHNPSDGCDQINTAAEARDYLIRLRGILTSLGVCDGKMEEGSLRCEPNVSIRPIGSKEFGTRTELKNLNSFRSVYRGLQYEIARQTEVVNAGGVIVHETRRWDEQDEITVTMRSKELEQEYRYFPEPDLLPFTFEEDYIEKLNSSLPELPLARKRRLMVLGLSDADAEAIVQDIGLARWFDGAVESGVDPATAGNWVLGELMRLLNASGESITECKIRPEALGELIGLINSGTISGKIAKSVFERMYNTGESPEKIVSESGQTQISDPDELLKAIRAVIADNPEIVQQILGGKDKSIGFLVGQVMKQTSGRANPQVLNELLRSELKSK